MSKAREQNIQFNIENPTNHSTPKYKIATKNHYKIHRHHINEYEIHLSKANSNSNKNLWIYSLINKKKLINFNFLKNDFNKNTEQFTLLTKKLQSKSESSDDQLYKAALCTNIHKYFSCKNKQFFSNNHPLKESDLKWIKALTFTIYCTEYISTNQILLHDFLCYITKLFNDKKYNSSYQFNHQEIFFASSKLNAYENEASAYKSTALMFAIQNGHTEIVNTLIDHGANVNIQTKNGFTALIFASANDHLDIIKILIEHGADLKQSVYGCDVFWIVKQNGHTEIVKILKEAIEKQNAEKLMEEKPKANEDETTIEAMILQDTKSEDDNVITQEKDQADISDLD